MNVPRLSQQRSAISPSAIHDAIFHEPRPVAYATKLPPYPASLAGTLLAAREAVMAPIRPKLREAGVTDQQWRVLRVLTDGGPLDAGLIAETALLYPATVTRILRELTQRGLLHRAPDPSDGRRTIVTIAACGLALVENTASQTALLLGQYEAAFGKERLVHLIAELAALTATVARWRPPGRSDAAHEAEGLLS